MLFQATDRGIGYKGACPDVSQGKRSVKTIVVEDAEQAAATRFLGSPSVRVNGIDVEPEARDRKEYGMG